MLHKIDSDLFRQFLAFLPTLVNVFLCQSHIFWLTNATYYLTLPGNVPSANLAECAFLGLFLEFGKLLFSWPGGMLLDKYGSNKMTLLVGFMNFLAWTMLFLSHSLNLVHIIRIIAGASLALNFCNYAAITGELSSPQFRGIFSSIVLLVGRLAAVFLSTVSLLFGSYKMLALGPAILSLLFVPIAYLAVESPYFLVQQGHPNRARHSLQRLHPSYSPEQVEHKLQQMSQFMKMADSEVTLWQIFAKSTYRNLVLRVCLINGFVQLSGAQIFTYYVTILLPHNQYVSNASYPLVISVTTLLAQFFWTIRIESYPRRKLFLITCPLSATLWLLMGTIYQCRLIERLFWKCVVYVDAIVTMAIMGALLLPLGDIISAEFFPFHIKGKANACVFLARSLFAIGSLITFDLIAEHLGMFCSFYFYSAMLTSLAVTVYFLLPESRGKSLINLQAEEEAECSENSGHKSGTAGNYGSIVANGK